MHALQPKRISTLWSIKVPRLFFPPHRLVGCARINHVSNVRINIVPPSGGQNPVQPRNFAQLDANLFFKQGRVRGRTMRCDVTMMEEKSLKLKSHLLFCSGV